MELSSPDPPGVGHGLGELHYRDVGVESVGVPGRVLDGPGYGDVHGGGPVTVGGDVVVPEPHVVGAGPAGDGVEAVGGGEDGVLVEEGPATHDLEPGAEPPSADYDGPGPGSGLRL